jgi:osmotically-inducible protein OsmY
MRTLRIAALTLGLISCAMHEPVNDQPQTLDTLATRVKTELINQAPLDAAAVEVQQRDGVIYLRGFADSEAKKQRMEAIARQVTGAHRVANQIQVK